MANYSTSANVILTVYGKQAQKMMSALEKDAKRLERQIAKAATAGDKATMKKLQRELNSTKRMMDQLKGSSASVDATLRRLDKASPKELNKALKLLQQQLNGIQRGTPAWDAHIAKIHVVKAELQKVNATLATQKSLWSRMNSWPNNAQTAIMAFAAAVTGIVMAGRKPVQSYADMEEQMANTIKYTRMTAAEVEELNEIFKGMDTRLAREQLNLLAQEGGPLGYNTVASVKEYVEAASIINVALVDLGEGATQTIAKLSNIFGMEQMYGVRDSMLKIGSTVNHLSQNCTAAKPFIVEFAQRMAGIGSTAKMTIPEIMAFAATLDAHGQKVEMSATALQRTIMELFKKPAEMARKNAYGSAAQVPVIGYILAPIAAAMAVAAGAIQIATIKKQQQASEAQGYSEGGFTPPGRKDEAVGVVHAGEWVASQKLVNNPQTRLLLEALDYAQRTNTIGSLTAADVSRSITAPMVLASQPVAAPVVVQSAPPTVVVEQNSEYAATMRQLADRLNEPFVTVNTVSGDHGIQQTQDEYDRLMKNKSPKSRK